MIKDLLIGFSFFMIVILFFYVVFNTVVVLSCLSSEGNVSWNKIVYACHFGNTISSYSVSQSISTTSYQNCSINGKPVDCDNIQDWVLEQGIRDI